MCLTSKKVDSSPRFISEFFLYKVCEEIGPFQLKMYTIHLSFIDRASLRPFIHFNNYCGETLTIRIVPSPTVSQEEIDLAQMQRTRRSPGEEVYRLDMLSADLFNITCIELLFNDEIEARHSNLRRESLWVEREERSALHKLCIALHSAVQIKADLVRRIIERGM